MIEIFRILDDMESILKDGKKLPLSSGKNIIDSGEFLERIDRLRAILPEELETARLLISEKERIIKEAYQQADQYVDESRHKVARMVDDSEITRNAVKMAEEIVQRAEVC
jgi:geranylgeranyl pyrophosphate synthase